MGLMDNAGLVLDALSDASLAGDWAQTKKFRREGSSEANPILGKYPSQSEVNQYFGGIMGTKKLANMSLPEKYNLPLNAAVLATQVPTLLYNKRQGVKMNTKSMLGAALLSAMLHKVGKGEERIDSAKISPYLDKKTVGVSFEKKF